MREALAPMTGLQWSGVNTKPTLYLFSFFGLITYLRAAFSYRCNGCVVIRDESGQRTFNLAQVFSLQLFLYIFTGSVYVVAPRSTKKVTSLLFSLSVAKIFFGYGLSPVWRLSFCLAKCM